MKALMRRTMRVLTRLVKETIRITSEVFDDWLTRAAGIVCILIVLIVIYNMRSNLPDAYPLLGALVYAMVPVLFIAGGVIFVMAILKFSKPENYVETQQAGNDNEASKVP